MATQNPIEMEGTYPLPEAQLDRFFFKAIVDYPTQEDLIEILERTTKREVPHGEKVMDADAIQKWQGFVRDVPVTPQVAQYAVRLVLATQPGSEHATDMVGKYARFGSSPRGAQALMLAGKMHALRDGRFNVGFDDIRRAALPALRHRVLLNFEAEADGVLSDAIINDIVERTAETGNAA